MQQTQQPITVKTYLFICNDLFTFINGKLSEFDLFLNIFSLVIFREPFFLLEPPIFEARRLI